MTNNLSFVTAVAVLSAILFSSSLRAENRNGAEYYLSHRDEYAGKRIVLFVSQTMVSSYGMQKKAADFDNIYLITVDGQINAHVSKNIVASFTRRYHRDGGFYYQGTGNPLSCIFKVEEDGKCYVEVDKI